MSNYTTRTTLLPIVLLFGFQLLIVDQTLAQRISFNRDVRPILSDRCYHCHGPDAKNQDSEFRVDSREHILDDLGGYAGIVPGNLEESELHARIHATDSDQMPPPESNRKLSEKEKKILDDWILSGANFEEHWGFRPIAATVPVPPVSSNATQAENNWPRNEIDHFVLDGIKEAGLSPNVEADRETWLRRVTFDLTGFAPTRAEMDAFLTDDSNSAFETVVDRLLATEASAERLASEWLDVARYSDSFGYQRDDERYVWPWRDWVVRSFRANMPYDQFITEQLAGDLLPNPTQDQILATTFNRLHAHNKEGGVSVEEFRVEYVSDRVHTLAGAFLGLTMECARCHDHKYDPIKTAEYYQLSAFFSNIDENGLISYFTDNCPTPAMPWPSAKQQSALDKAEAAIQAAEKKLAGVRADGELEYLQWLNNHEATSDISDQQAYLTFENWEPVSKEEAKDEQDKNVDPISMRGVTNEVPSAQLAVTTDKNELVAGKFGNAIKLTGDDAVVLPKVGHFGREHPFTISLWMKTPEITERAVIFRRSRGWDDCGSIGYALTKKEGRLNFMLAHFDPGDAISIETTESLNVDQWYHVAVAYDGSSTAAGMKIFVDGRPAKTKIEFDHLTRNITQWRDGYYDLAIGSRYRDRGFKDGFVDEFRAFDRQLSELEIIQIFDQQSLPALLEIAADKLTSAQSASLREYFFSAVHEPTQTALKELQQKRLAQNQAIDATPAIMIMRERTTGLRPTYVLTRGVYDSHGAEVSADTPKFLPPFPADQPRNRLGLARWLTAPDHPLTSRVTVNRYWQLMFGNGLVRTPEDFGNQGTPPTDPELLDWLSRDFMSHRWNVNRLLKNMALSATYRQSSIVSPEVRRLDPENIYFARGPSQRLTAEMVRDNALAVSGLLVDKVGGPPVKPYDVALAYTPLPADTGDGLYRRSLYTFWRRTSPAPVMITMDANKREVCRLKRETTSSPLQAMVLLNAPQFIEASRVFAEKLLREDQDEKALATTAFRLLTSRQPTDRESEILLQLFDEQLAHFQSKPNDAAELLKTGDNTAPEDFEPARLAAATVLINSIMNLDESVRNK